MKLFFFQIEFRSIGICVLTVLLFFCSLYPAKAGPVLLYDMSYNEVLDGYNIDEAWYPASLTKLMTVYVALRMIRRGLVSYNTPIYMTEEASKNPPSKLGLAPGETITLRNAIRVLLSVSANDVAEALAANLSQSADAYVTQMNIAAKRLGMERTHYANASGLFHKDQVSTARDTAIIASALLREFPEVSSDFLIEKLVFRGQTLRNHNDFIGRYQGAIGIKTGFICAAGYNLAAAARRNGRRLLAIVLGAPSESRRMKIAAALIESGFRGESLKRYPPLPLSRLPWPNSAPEAPQDLRSQVCGTSPTSKASATDRETQALTDYMMSLNPPVLLGKAPTETVYTLD